MTAQLDTPATALPTGRTPAAAAATPSLQRWLRHALVLARRSLVKMRRTPEALIDVTLQPVIFLALFTYIFGVAVAGVSQTAYLQFLLP